MMADGNDNANDGEAEVVADDEDGEADGQDDDEADDGDMADV